MIRQQFASMNANAACSLDRIVVWRSASVWRRRDEKSCYVGRRSLRLGRVGRPSLLSCGCGVCCGFNCACGLLCSLLHSMIFIELNKGEKNMVSVKAAGKYIQEGKNYIVQVRSHNVYMRPTLLETCVVL